jgi:hypothetical protein
VFVLTKQFEDYMARKGESTAVVGDAAADAQGEE